MPPPALFAQVPQRLRHLGPADGVRGVADAVGDAVLPAEDVEPDHQLHVLPHRAGVVAPGADDHALFEQAKGPRDDDTAVETVEKDAGGQKGALIFQHLHAGQDPVGHVVADHLAVFDLRSVAGPHRAPHRHHMVVLQHRPDDLLQGIALEHRVGVHTEEVGIAGGVDAHVQGVGLAAVALADEGDGDLAGPGLKDGLSLLAWDLPLDGPVDLPHLKGPAQDLRRSIGGAVVHHDDLVEPVMQGQQGADGGLDGDLLIVGRHQDGHGDIVVVEELIFQQVPAFGPVELRGAHRHRQEEKAGIAHHVEDKKDTHPVKKDQQEVSHGASLLSSSASICLVSRRYIIISRA